MSNKILVQVCNENYLEQAKYLFANAKIHGKWDGDYCLIANNISPNKLNFLKETEISIFNIKSSNFYYAKLNIFDIFFKQWDYVLYFDQDIVIFDDISIEELPPKKIMFADLDRPFTIDQYLCQMHLSDQKEKAISELKTEYPFINEPGYNTGFLYFNTSLIEEDTVEKINNLKDRLSNINNHASIGSDQPIINLYFYQNLSSNSFCSFWRTPENKIKKAAHFCHGEAPWNNNTYSNKMNKSYKEHYEECLSLFDKKFRRIYNV
jgi:lipopolysaccharide biosynthesis glycosyltransferase